MAMSLANEAEGAVEGGAVIASDQGHSGTLNVNATALTTGDISNDAQAQDSQKKSRQLLLTLKKLLQLSSQPVARMSERS